ncbi:MAG: hypothetical protein ACRESR_00505 [Gammaproteobacteria bacterium]
MKPDPIRRARNALARKPPGLARAAGLGLTLSATALLGACASGPPAPQPRAPLVIAGRTPQTILGKKELTRIASSVPASRQKNVTRAEAFGQIIYRHDRLAREAGRLVAPNGETPFSFPPAGWLTERTPSGLGLVFIVHENRKLDVAAEVTDTGAGPDLHRVTPPRALTVPESILWKARQIAYSSKFKPCAKRYNPVVVPVREHGERFIDVFLLPASADPHTIYLGGYQRVVVSPDGNAILEAHSFTHGCITLHSSGKTTGAKVTEIVSETPTAPQVYASLRYGLPIYVQTLGNGLSWLVKDGKVSLEGKTSR